MGASTMTNKQKKSSKKVARKRSLQVGFSGTDAYINRDALKEAHAVRTWGR